MKMNIKQQFAKATEELFSSLYQINLENSSQKILMKRFNVA